MEKIDLELYKNIDTLEGVNDFLDTNLKLDKHIKSEDLVMLCSTYISYYEGFKNMTFLEIVQARTLSERVFDIQYLDLLSNITVLPTEKGESPIDVDLVLQSRAWYTNTYDNLYCDVKREAHKCLELYFKKMEMENALGDSLLTLIDKMDEISKSGSKDNLDEVKGIIDRFDEAISNMKKNLSQK